MDNRTWSQKLIENRVLVVVVALVILIAMIVLFSSGKGNNTVGPETIATNSRAALVYEDNVYLPVGSVDGNNMLLEDIAYFARTEYKAYNPSKQPAVNFFVDKSKVNGEVIEFSGKYEKIKNPISIRVTRLNNDRLNVSITDNKTKRNINSKLPSASKQNKFIATLPINEDQYNVVYEAPDTVSIQSYVRDPAIFSAAQARIESLIGKEEAKKLNITITFPTAGFNE